MRPNRRHFAAVLIALACALLLAACAASPTNGQVEGSPTPAQREAPTPAPVSPAPTAPAPRGDGPVVAGSPVQVDTSCRVDADCTVKNVGNCCGYYPACVNVDSPTDPEGVQAECARSGMASVCGFRDISACSCVAGQCQAQDSGRPQIR